MKSAYFSLDLLFRAAAALAKRFGISKSLPFARAMEEHVESQGRESVRQALDEVYSKESSELDSVLARMQWAAMPKEDW